MKISCDDIVYDMKKIDEVFNRLMYIQDTL